MTPELPIIWSYGGGTQSLAIAVIVARGELPTPERVVIAFVGVSLMSDVLLRYVIAMLIIVLLHDHWMSPDVNG